MPNWCGNTLEVMGPEATLDEFVRGTTVGGDGKCLSFELLVPEPKEEKEDSFARGWRIDSGWGTKWNLPEDDCDFAREPGVAVWSFMTAWSPPLLWAERVAVMFPELTFRLGYDEPGMNFCGVQRFTGGQHTEEGSWEMEGSLTMLGCPVPTCDEYVPDSGVSVLDFTSKPTGEQLVTFCDHHELEEAVYIQQTRPLT